MELVDKFDNKRLPLSKQTERYEKTKGESVEFTTTTIEGTLMKLSDGTWSRTHTFDTYTEAIEYLEKIINEFKTEGIIKSITSPSSNGNINNTFVITCELSTISSSTVFS